jgi:tetraacyldisaccharide 4'-kinase
MGGRGKTPVVAHIARLLIDAGERPAILSRGYRRRRREEGVVIVSDGVRLTADLDRAGDEPLMLARMVPGAAVLVCDVRAMAAAVAERQLDVTVHILDDGFQHQSIRRDVDIVVIRPSDLNGRRMPFGKLRSSPSSLQRAHAVVIEADENSLVGIARESDDPPFQSFTMTRTLGTPEPLEPSRPWPAGRWPVVAVAGIAEPTRFTRALQAAGWLVARTMGFRDHHPFSARDVEKIAAAVRETGAGAVLTTTKDAMRLLPLRPLPVPVAAVPLDITIDPPDLFRAWLIERVRKARA